jgi:tRNA(Phe) wybutosine-synthesizing methylase Tyw3
MSKYLQDSMYIRKQHFTFSLKTTLVYLKKKNREKIFKKFSPKIFHIFVSVFVSLTLLSSIVAISSFLYCLQLSDFAT